MDVKRICALCGVDRTPLLGGIYQINDRRGDSLGLFGECCVHAVLDAVKLSPYKYGGTEFAHRERARELILDKAKGTLKCQS